MSSESPSCSSSSPPSLPRVSVWRQKSTAEEATARHGGGRGEEEEGDSAHDESPRPRPRWSMDSTATFQFGSEDAAMSSAAAGAGAAGASRPHVPRLRLRRLSEEAAVHVAYENTSPLSRRGNNNNTAASVGLREGDAAPAAPTKLDVPRLARGFDYRAATVVVPQVLPQPVAAAIDNNPPSVFDSPSESTIAVSPPPPKLNLPRAGVTPTNVAVSADIDSEAREVRVNAHAAAVREEEVASPPSWSPSVRRSTAPTAMAAVSARSASAPGASHRIRSSSRLNLASPGTPYITVRWKRTSSATGDGSTRTGSCDMVQVAGQQPSSSSVRAFESSLSNEAPGACSSLSDLDLSEIRTGATPMPSVNNRRLPPLVQPSKLQGIVSADVSPSAASALHAPTLSRHSSLVTYSESVVMSASSLSPPPANPPASPTALTGTASRASPDLQLAVTSLSPDYPALSPPPPPLRAAPLSDTAGSATVAVSPARDAASRTPPTVTAVSPRPSMTQLDAGCFARDGVLAHFSLDGRSVSSLPAEGRYALYEEPAWGVGVTPCEETVVHASLTPPPPPPPLPPPPPPQTSFLSYVQQMPAPRYGGRSFSCLLMAIGTCLCTIPLCGSVFLLGLHYWAVELQERSYTAASHRPHVGGMRTTAFTLLLGVVLCAFVMGVGGGLCLYMGAYRQAVRYQQRAFSLCTRISHICAAALAEREAAAARVTGSVVEPTAWNAALSSVAAVDAALTPQDAAYLAAASLARVLRWHREVAFLLSALAAPLEVPARVATYFDTVPSTHGHPPLLSCTHHSSLPPRDAGSFSLLSGAAAGAAGTATPDVVGVAPVPILRDSVVSLPGSGQRDVEGPLRSACVELSRRPRHPVDESRVRDSVTVVVCRFLVPPSLSAGTNVLSRAQLTELEELSRDFHSRLRRAVQGCQAYTTVCGVTEVVFSLNTVLPVQVLVANTSAIALALAARRALVEWAAQCDGSPVRWGVSVHRFDAFLRSARAGGGGRLTLSFGTHEYTVARDLASLAALCGYEVLCHAAFFTDAMSEARGFPVDYVMDRMKSCFLVYQLHEEAVSEGTKRGMADALALMRHGEYDKTCRFLHRWERETLEEGRSFPNAAHHLCSVARSLCTAGGSADVNGTMPAAAGWSAWLAHAYCRPPPVWEEEEAGEDDCTSAAITQRLLAPLASLMGVAAGTGDVGERATTSTRASVSVTPASRGEMRLTRLGSPLPARAGGVTGAPESVGGGGDGGGGGGVATLLQRVLPQLFGGSSLRAAPSSNSGDDDPAPVPTQQQQQHGIERNGSSHTGDAAVASTTTSTRVEVGSVRIPCTLDTPVGGARGLLSPVSPLCGTARSPPFAIPPLPLGSHLTRAPVTVSLPRAMHDAPAEASASLLNPLSPLSDRSRDDGEVAFADGRTPLEPQPTIRSAGTRRVRRRGSSDSKGSRSRGRSCSFFFDDESAENEFTPRVAPHSLWLSDHARSVMEEVGAYMPTSALSAPSLTFSSHTQQQRSAPLPSKLPLFADSAGTLPDIEDRDENNSSNSEVSFAEVSHERSMTSVVQRSRSSMSARAASLSAAAAVVCTRTRSIASDRSGMTRVFQGFHPSGYLVAIKQVSKQSARQLQLQRNEVHLLHRLSHPNIVHIIADWEDATAVYMAMEYASDTLTSVLAKFGRLLPGAVRHYVRGVLQALAYLHDTKGVVHRDLSPNNILITNVSDSSQAKLIDFGRSMVLRRSRSALESPMTATNVTLPGFAARASSRCPSEISSPRGMCVVAPTYATVVGTPMFMSPQACQGMVHPANDVWGVGVIMFLCLTGDYPYPPDTLVDPDTFVTDVGSGRLVPTLAALRDTTSGARDFIEQCLLADHTARPTAAALLQHSFLTV